MTSAAPTLDAPTVTLGYASTLGAATQVLQVGGSGAVGQASVVNFPVAGLTLSFWVKASGAQPGSVLFSYDGATGDVAHRLFVRNPANLEILFGSSTTGGIGQAIDDGAWHQLAITVSPSDATHYAVGVFKDGMPVFYGVGALSHPAGTVLRSGRPLVLGQGIGQEPGFAGTLSEFRLLQGVQPAAAIATTMEVRFPDADPATVLHWALSSAQTSGTLSGDAGFTAASLAFRTQQLGASWTAVTGAQSYELEVVATDGTWRFDQSGIAGTQAPVTGFSVNTACSGRVRAYAGGQPGPWSAPSPATLLNLQQPIASLSNPQGTTLTVSWPAVDQAQQYQVALYQDQSATPTLATQQGTTYDMTALAQSASSWRIAFSAQSLASTGPATAPAVLAAPALAFAFTAETGKLAASWPAQAGVAYWYLQITDVTTGQSVTNSLLPPATTSFEVPSPAEAQQYTAKLRAIGLGAVTAWSPVVTVTVHNMPGPLIQSVTADAGAHTVSVTWTFSYGGVANPSFGIELRKSGDPWPAPVVVQGTSYTYPSNPDVVRGASFELRMQAQADGSAGRWTEPWPFVVGAPPQLSGLTASAAPNRDVSVAWTPLGTAGVTYSVRISGNGVDYTSSALTGSSVILPASATNVQVDKTYSVTAWATLQGVAGPTAQVSVKIEPPRDDHGFSFLDPVDTTTGAFRYQHVELFVQGVVPLVFITTYASSLPLPAAALLDAKLGNRWTHAFAIRLVRSQDGKTIYAVWGDGSTQTFAVPSSVTGNYAITSVANGSTLFLGNDMRFVLTTKQQDRYFYTYDGRLDVIQNAVGNQTLLTYNGDGTLHRVTDPVTGCYLELRYQGGFLTTLTDGSRSVGFQVVSGDLQTVTNAMGKPRGFTYTGASLMEKVIDEKGNVLVKNGYQSSRVVSQQDARAIAHGQSYASTFAYTPETIGGIEYVVCDITDRAGNPMRVRTMKNNGRAVWIRYDLGANVRVVEREYDGFLNVVKETLFDGAAADYQAGRGNTWRFTYGDNSNLETVTDPLGRIARYEYDAANHVKLAVDFDGNATTYVYNGNLLMTVQPPLGGSLEYTYWAGSVGGLVKTFTDPIGNVASYTYTGGRLLTATLPLGGTFTYAWNAWGAVSRQTARSAAGTHLRTVAVTYWDSGQQKDISIFLDAQLEVDAFVTRYTFDDAGNPATTTGPTGVVLTYHFDPNNFLDRLEYPPFRGASRVTSYTYDRIDYLWQSIFSASVTSAETHDALGRLLTFTDPNRKVYSYARGMDVSAGLPYPITLALSYPLLDGDPTVYSDRFRYDAAERLIDIRDRIGNLTSLAYATRPGAGGSREMVVTVTLPRAKAGDPQLTVVRVTNALGDPVSLTDQAGNTTSYAYATANDPATGTFQRVVTVTDAAARVRVLTYDALGRLVSERLGPSATGTITTYGYDALGRLLSASQQADSRTIDTVYTYGFDAATKRLKVTIGSPGGQPTRTQYFNGLKQLVSESDALGRSTVYDYTPWGSVGSYTNRRGQRLDFGSDLAGRLTSLTLPSAASIVHTVDANGNRLRTERTPQPAIVRTFDVWNRLSTRTDGHGKKVQYAYWPTGEVKSLTYPDGRKVDYRVDGLRRVDLATDWANRVTSFGYTPAGLLHTLQLPNGALTTLDYDAGYAVTGVTHANGALLLAKVTYAIDPQGRPQSGMSVLALAPTFPQLPVAMTYGASDQLATYGGQTLSSDDDGDLLTLPSASGLQTLDWDVFGAVTGNGADILTYDDDGMLASLSRGGVESRFVRDVAGWLSPPRERGDPERRLAGVADSESFLGSFSGLPIYGASAVPVAFDRALDRVLEITDAAGAVLSRFVHGPSGVLGMETASGDYFTFHADPAGNTLALTGPQGEITDRYVYGPFGALWARSGKTPNPFLFGGRDGSFDLGEGLISMRSRAYAPGLLRFVSRDVLTGSLYRPQTLDWYAYVAGDPLRWVDPLGLFLVGVAVVGGVALLGALGYGLYTYVTATGAATGAGALTGDMAIELESMQPLLRGRPPSTTPSPEGSPPTSPRGPTGWRPSGFNQWESPSGGQQLSFRGGRTLANPTGSSGSSGSLNLGF